MSIQLFEPTQFFRTMRKKSWAGRSGYSVFLVYKHCFSLVWYWVNPHFIGSFYALWFRNFTSQQKWIPRSQVRWNCSPPWALRMKHCLRRTSVADWSTSPCWCCSYWRWADLLRLQISAHNCIHIILFYYFIANNICL